MRTDPPPSRRPPIRAPKDGVRFRFQSAYPEEALKRRLEKDVLAHLTPTLTSFIQAEGAWSRFRMLSLPRDGGGKGKGGPPKLLGL